MAMVYKFKPGFSCGVNPQSAGEELARLRAANDDGLTPCAVIEAARSPDSPLHGAFTWDDGEAADEWRKTEARRLIANIRVIRADAEGRLRPMLVHVSVPTPGQGRRYVEVGRVMSSDDLRQHALAEALGQLDALERRFAHLTELAAVFDAVRLARQAS